MPVASAKAGVHRDRLVVASNARGPEILSRGQTLPLTFRNGHTTKTEIRARVIASQRRANNLISISDFDNNVPPLSRAGLEFSYRVREHFVSHY